MRRRRTRCQPWINNTDHEHKPFVKLDIDIARIDNAVPSQPQASSKAVKSQGQTRSRTSTEQGTYCEEGTRRRTTVVLLVVCTGTCS